VGLAGPPGSGKSTLAAEIAKKIELSIVVPMDGYHFPKIYLDSLHNSLEAYERRGAHWTFDVNSFLTNLRLSKSNGYGYFPSFDQNVGDPVENEIYVSREHKVVIVEGNYLLIDVPPWNEIRPIFHLNVYLRCDLDEITRRIVLRHISTGLTEQVAIERVNTNDILNAKFVMSYMHNADLVIESYNDTTFSTRI